MRVSRKFAVAACVVDGAVVAAVVVCGVDHGVAVGACCAAGVAFPDGGCAAGLHGESGEKPAKGAVPDYEIRKRGAWGGHGVARRGGECEECAAFAQGFGDGDEPGAACDDAGGGAAEKAAHFAVAAGTRYEDMFAYGAARLGAGFAHLADGFVAWDEWVAHARKGRHAAAVEKALGACADAAEGDVHDAFVRRHGRQGEGCHGELLGSVQNDCVCVQDDLPARTRSPGGVNCKPRLTLRHVNADLQSYRRKQGARE